MPASLCTLPPELLETSLGLIDKPSDLLALALTCRLLARLVLPRHLCYRELSLYCFVNGHLLWAHLAASPGLARNVRSLSIGTDTRAAVHVPASSVDCAADLRATFPRYDVPAAQASFGAALARMTRLQKFTWRSAAGELREDARNDWVWPLLCAGGARLKEMDVAVKAWDIPWDAPPAGTPRSSVFDMDPCALERLAMHFSTAPALDDALCARLAAFLAHSTALRTLNLIFCWRHRAPVDLSAALAQAHLPSLRHISLANARVRAQPLARFLRRHPRLAALHLVSGRVDLAGVPQGVVPSLERFQTARVGDVVQLARIGAPRLQELRMTLECAEALVGRPFYAPCDRQEKEGTPGEWPVLLAPFRETLERVVVTNDENEGGLYPFEAAVGLVVLREEIKARVVTATAKSRCKRPPVEEE